jgi:deoxycytidylate deaminase
MISSMNKKDGIKYPYLPEGREILYVTEDNEFMKAAKQASLDLSTDVQHPTGAVVVKEGKIVGRGANQAGYKNKKLIEFHLNGMCFRRWFKIKSGEKYWMCRGCSTNRKHAETRAVNDALKNLDGGSDKLQNADLYLWGHWWACEPCWKSILDAGVRNVYLLENSEVYFNRNHPNHVIGKAHREKQKELAGGIK